MPSRSMRSAISLVRGSSNSFTKPCKKMEEEEEVMKDMIFRDQIRRKKRSKRRKKRNVHTCLRRVEKWNRVKREGEEMRKEERRGKNGTEKVRKMKTKEMEKRRDKFFESRSRERLFNKIITQ